MTARLPVPADARVIDLSRSEFRHLGKMGHVRFALYCARHPIYAFMAYQAVNPDPPDTKARHEALFWTAAMHGVVAYFIAAHN